MRQVSYPSIVFRTHRGFGIFSILVAGTLQFLVIKAITTIDTTPILPAFMSQLPERFRMIINENLISQLTVEGGAAFGFSHPIMMVLLAINAVSIPARHVSGEIEDGTMEFLLAHPVGRMRLLLSLWVVTGLINLFVVCGALLGSVTALTVFHRVSGGVLVKLLEIGANLWVLFLLVQSVAMLSSTYGGKGSRPALWTAVVVLTFYVLHFLTPLWDALRVTTRINIFTYYQPQKLMFDQGSFGQDILVLAVLTGICLSLALHQFSRRDIPG
jgi:ABC-2 type transport system permease protein